MPQIHPRRSLFFIDRIESSSYPVTETGYAMVHRAFLRARAAGGEIYVAYPDMPWSFDARGELRALAHRISAFADSPYDHFRSQRDSYRAGDHVGSQGCHEQLSALELPLAELDAIVWRQETREPEQAAALLRALASVEQRTLVYQSPRLALDPALGSKQLPRKFDPRYTPRTHHTDEPGAPGLGDKAERAVAFVRDVLEAPDTVIAKPLRGDNGVGIHVVGRDPRTGKLVSDASDRACWSELIACYGELVVQEYIPSVRSPVGSSAGELAAVPPERHDFGEVRFLLIDGELPRRPDGTLCQVARRVPVPTSLVADSGISHATTLSEAEVAFLTRLGAQYRSWGIHFGGGDLIRTPDPARPFVFTDAAQSVCGHAVVTGALNGAPYMIVDQVLDSIERQLALRQAQAAWPASRPRGRFNPPRLDEACRR